MATLPPVAQPIGIFPKMIAQQSETLVIKEKVLSLSGDSFDIKLGSGQPIFKVQGRHMTISGRKSFTDMDNNPLFDVVKEFFHIHTTFAAEDPQGNKFLEVKSGITLIGSKATATFKSTTTGKEEVLKMKGNWLDTKSEIVCESTGAVIARIDRSLFKGREIFFDQQTYGVVVAPGVDMALVAALCVCFDEKNNENS